MRLLFQFITLGFLLGMTPLKIAIEYIPKKLDSQKVESVTDYYLLEHLLRPLVSFNSSGALIGDLAKKWEINDDFTEYSFSIKTDEKFSDGTVIDVKDIVASIQRGLKFGQTVHVNFLNIDSVEINSKSSFTIKLKKPDRFFLYNLDAPEFRVLHRSDYQKPQNEQSFSITSGVYAVNEKKDKHYHLTHNIYSSEKDVDVKEVIIEWANYRKSPEEMILQDGYDLVWNSTKFEKIDLNKINVKNPRMSFSFWLTVDQRSPIFNDLERKVYLLNMINKYKESEKLNNEDSITYSRQLYLPDGPGRPSDKELSEIYKSLSEIPEKRVETLRLLLSERREVQHLVKNAFTGLGLEIDTYVTFDEYKELLDKNRYDLIQTNNDFSYPELRGVLNVTFNEKRPLIFPANDFKIKMLLEKINNEVDPVKRSLSVKEIGVELLKTISIIPLFYYHLPIYHSRSIDLSKWSNVTPDLSIWKIKKK